MRRFRPADVERSGVAAVLSARGDECVGVGRMDPSLLGGNEARAHAYAVRTGRERSCYRSARTDSSGGKHRYLRHGFEHLAEQIQEADGAANVSTRLHALRDDDIASR